ncbi:TcpE family conjugal transfer membrane protein [Nonomuraea mangrovi]|uniref:TcpE family conjugal transfer membrane protein n=1 Tax=Nonomuraea mangrovi TaxID=2316207 RepID=A0ABW4THB3_9ACTN
MDLPTYTNIWRIEKRLYKLYDLRLPMPLPIVWIGVFVGVLAPWSVLLWLVGIGFEAPWHVLYLVPPGIVTWLSTRPVIENKRLTELMQSQLRYMGEPRSWCRMAPAGEPETVTFSGRVWRAAPAPARAKARAAARKRHAAPAVARSRQVRPAVAAAAAAATRAPVAETAPARPAWGGATGRRHGVAPALLQTELDASLSPVRHADLASVPLRVEVTPDPAPGDGLVVEVARTAEHVTGQTGLPDAPAPPMGDGADHEDAGEAGSWPAREDVREAGAGLAREDAEEAGSGSGLVRGGAREAGTAAARGDAKKAERGSTRWGSRIEPGAARTPAPDAPASPSAASASTAASPEAPSAASTSAAVSPASTSAAVSPASASVAADPGSTAGASASMPPKPIGTEALRRLRRLAATADASAEPAADVSAVPEAPALEAPAAPLTAALTTDRQAADRQIADQQAADRQAGEQAADRQAEDGQVELPTVHQGPEEVEGHSPASLPELPPTFEPSAATGVPQRGPRRADDARQAEDQARDQHRKGQPPLTTAVVFQGQVKPTIPSIGQGKRPSRSPAERSAQPPLPTAPAERRPVPRPASPPAQGAPPLNIRAVQAPATPGTAVPGARNEPRVRRVESVVGRDSSGGWRRLAQVVVGGGGSRTDGSEIDEARTRAVFGGSRRVVVLGCTGGAGQSTTALMLGHTLAHYRDDRVLAVDASTGGSTLTSRIKAESPETLTSLLSGLGQISGYLGMRAFTTRTGSGLEVVAADTDIGAEQRLADRTLYSDQRLGQAMRLLDHHYKLAVVDPAPALAARVLPYADQLVLVVPASEDAAEAVAMTYEWLDGHGCADLRRRAVMVVNGVSRRSMTDVEQAEAVARGRCRAIVRVPWEDELAQGGTEPVEPGQLRPAGRRAYLALAGVVIAGFASAQSTRPSEEEVAQ